MVLRWELFYVKAQPFEAVNNENVITSNESESITRAENETVFNVNAEHKRSHAEERYVEPFSTILSSYKLKAKSMLQHWGYK